MRFNASQEPKVAHGWTEEKLLALTNAELAKLRVNAAAKGVEPLVAQIVAIQLARKPEKKVKQAAAAAGAHRSDSPVIGFHFVCPDDYEVEQLSDGRFWSGVWHVAEAHCGPAQEMRGYVALHTNRSSRSHRQGTVVGWRTEPRTKGKTPMGISFLLVPFEEPLRWYGDAAGERGYRRVDHEPAWVPR